MLCLRHFYVQRNNGIYDGSLVLLETAKLFAKRILSPLCLNLAPKLGAHKHGTLFNVDLASKFPAPLADTKANFQA